MTEQDWRPGWADECDDCSCRVVTLSDLPGCTWDGAIEDWRPPWCPWCKGQEGKHE